MDIWRQSFVFCKEREFGKGQSHSDMLGYWYVPPPGSVFSSTYSRDTNRLDPVGAKMWSDTAYGKVSGSWTWTFNLDYDYMEPFMFVFDKYWFSEDPRYPRLGRHNFARTENGITPSFCVRRKTLHRVVGGTYDEIDELYGCICTSFHIGNNAGESKLAVTLSGVYADEYMGTAASDYDNKGNGLVKLQSTDYVDRARNVVEFACLSIDGEAVSDVTSLAVQSKCPATMIHGILNPIARSYYEPSVSNAISCTIFAKDPRIVRQRVYTGGVARNNKTRRTRVMPTREMAIRACAGTEPDSSEVIITAKDVVLKTIGWSMQDAEYLQDKLEGADCKDISISVINKIPYQYNLCMYRDSSFNADYEGTPKPIISVNGMDQAEVAGVAKTHLITSRMG